MGGVAGDVDRADRRGGDRRHCHGRAKSSHAQRHHPATRAGAAAPDVAAHVAGGGGSDVAGAPVSRSAAGDGGRARAGGIDADAGHGDADPAGAGSARAAGDAAAGGWGVSGAGDEGSSRGDVVGRAHPTKYG